MGARRRYRAGGAVEPPREYGHRPQDRTGGDTRKSSPEAEPEDHDMGPRSRRDTHCRKPAPTGHQLRTITTGHLLRNEPAAASTTQQIDRRTRGKGPEQLADPVRKNQGSRTDGAGAGSVRRRSSEKHRQEQPRAGCQLRTKGPSGTNSNPMGSTRREIQGGGGEKTARYSATLPGYLRISRRNGSDRRTRLPVPESGRRKNDGRAHGRSVMRGRTRKMLRNHRQQLRKSTEGARDDRHRRVPATEQARRRATPGGVDKSPAAD